MNFKQYMTKIWQPMQNQAKATGKNPADINVEASMQRHIAPRITSEAHAKDAESRGEHTGQRLDLRKKGLDLDARMIESNARIQADRLQAQKDSLSTSKRLAPWAIGLGVGNLATSYFQGRADRKRNLEDSALLRRYNNEMQNWRKQNVPTPY